MVTSSNNRKDGGSTRAAPCARHFLRTRLEGVRPAPSCQHLPRQTRLLPLSFPPHLIHSPPGHLVRDCAQCGMEERQNKTPPLKIKNKTKIWRRRKKIPKKSLGPSEKNDMRDDWCCDQLRAAGAWAASARSLVLFRCMRLHVLGQEVGTGALAQRHNISVVLVSTEG